MRILIISSILSVALFSSCTNSSQNINSKYSQDSNIDSQITTFGKYTTDIDGKVAIGNICFGISKSEFEKQKKIFLKETPSLAGIQINNIKGYFHNDRLFSVILNSKGYMCGDGYVSQTGLPCGPTNTNDWIDLYANKYENYRTKGEDNFEEIGFYFNNSATFRKDGIQYYIIDNLEFSPKMYYYSREKVFFPSHTYKSDLEHEMFDVFMNKNKYDNKVHEYKGYRYIEISNYIYLDSIDNVKKKAEEKEEENRKKQYEKDLNSI